MGYHPWPGQKGQPLRPAAVPSSSSSAPQSPFRARRPTTTTNLPTTSSDEATRTWLTDEVPA
eukprot:8940725-Pyramimonas_sp.AAC.1